MKKALIAAVLAILCAQVQAKDYRNAENSTSYVVTGVAVGYAATTITQRFFDVGGQDTKARRITAICVGILATSIYSAQNQGPQFFNPNKAVGSLAGIGAGIVLNWSFRF